MSDQPPTISLCDLPEDVLLHIIGFLEPPYIEVLMRVNQIFNRLAKSGFLWRSITEREYSTHSTRQLLHLFCMLVRLRHEQVWKGASKFVIQSQLDSLHLSDNYQLPDDFDSEYPTPSPLLCKLLLQIARQDGINRWRLFQHFWNHFPQEICNDAIINLINMRMKRTKDLVEACETSLEKLEAKIEHYNFDKAAQELHGLMQMDWDDLEMEITNIECPKSFSVVLHPNSPHDSDTNTELVISQAESEEIYKYFTWHEAYKFYKSAPLLMASNLNWTTTILLRGHTNWARYTIPLPLPPTTRLNDEYLLSCGDDSCIRLWSIAKAKNIATIHRAHIGHILELEAHYIGNDTFLIASSGTDGIVKIWRMEWKEVTNSPTTSTESAAAEQSQSEAPCTGLGFSMNVITELKGHLEIIRCTRFIDDTYVVTASHDNTLRKWNVRTGNCERIYMGHTASVLDCQVVPSHNLLISASEDESIIIFNLETGNIIRRLLGHKQSVRRIRLLENYAGKLYDECMNMLANGAETTAQETAHEIPQYLFCVSVSYDNSVRIWHLASGLCVRVIENAEYREICGLHLVPTSYFNDSLPPSVTGSTSPDCLYTKTAMIITAGYDHTVHLFDFDSGKELAQIAGHYGIICDVKLWRDLLITASTDRDIRVTRLSAVSGFILD